MALPTFPQSAADFIAAINDETFPNGGHRTAFPASLDAVRALVVFANEALAVLEGMAEQVALDAVTAEEGSGTEATVANIRAIANVAHYVSMRNIIAANASVDLTDGSTINWNAATGINFKIVLGGVGRTLANPSNKVVGKSGLIRVFQDATGGRSITTFGSDYVWIGGQPFWPTAPNARSLISYYMAEDGKVELTFGGSSA